MAGFYQANSALSVVTLINEPYRLYERFLKEIDPSYRHLVSQLSEIEIIRSFDPELAKRKSKNVKNMELVTMHVSRLPRGTCAPDMYSALTGHAVGHRHVYTSARDRYRYWRQTLLL